MTVYSSVWNEQFDREISNFLKEGGKRLRPVLAAIVYEGTGGNDLDSFIKIALSTEILHNSTLIHDDIIDESDMRRNKSSFHKRFEKWFRKRNVDKAKDASEAMAILAGDHLIFLSFQCVLDSNFPNDKKLYVIKIIRDTSEIVIKGQILDDELENGVANEKDYIQLIEMKTASVFESATKVATTLSEVDSKISSLLWKYAKHIGCAFQIQDDILGVFGKQSELGKPLTSDLASGKKTILTIKAYENANDSQKTILDKIISRKNINQDDVETIKKLFREVGALEYARGMANKYANESIRLLAHLKGKIRYDTFKILHKLPTFIINRKY